MEYQFTAKEMESHLKELEALALVEKDEEVIQTVTKCLEKLVSYVKKPHNNEELLYFWSKPEKVQELSVNRSPWEIKGERCTIVNEHDIMVKLLREDQKTELTQEIIDLIKTLDTNTPTDVQRQTAFKLAEAAGACKCIINTVCNIEGKPTTSTVSVYLHTQEA